MPDLKELGCTVGPVSTQIHGLPNKYHKMRHHTPSCPYKDKPFTAQFNDTFNHFEAKLNYCTSGFADSGHSVAQDMSIEGSYLNIMLPMDASWTDGVLRYPLTRVGHFAPTEARKAIYYDLDAIITWARSTAGKNDLLARCEYLRSQIMTALNGRPYIEISDIRTTTIKTANKGFIVAWTVFFKALNPALQQASYQVTVDEHDGIWSPTDLERFLSTQDKRLATRKKTTDKAVLIDLVIKPYVEQLISDMGREAFFDLIANADDTMPKGTLPRNIIKNKYRIEYPPELARLTLKHGVLSGKVHYGSNATWTEGQLKYAGDIPLALEAAIKGGKGSLIIDHPVLRDKTITGYRKKDGQKIITFADIYVPYSF